MRRPYKILFYTYMPMALFSIFFQWCAYDLSVMVSTQEIVGWDKEERAIESRVVEEILNDVAQQPGNYDFKIGVTGMPFLFNDVNNNRIYVFEYSVDVNELNCPLNYSQKRKRDSLVNSIRYRHVRKMIFITAKQKTKQP